MSNIINIEQYAKEGKKPEKGQKYQFRVDKTMVLSETECLNGQQILELAGLNPDKFLLRQIKRGNNVVPIALDQEVCFTEPGIERFVTVPKDPKDGSRAFSLPEQDEEYFNNQGFLWETLIENKKNWFIIRNFPLIHGYNVSKCDIAIEIPTGYPASRLDMAYFYPPLLRSDGIPIPQTQVHTLIGGRSFQRWSRHRNAIQWRTGVDSLITHFLEIEHWFENEFKKRPRRNEAA